MRTLTIVRGLPGSGKTTFVKEVLKPDYHHEADFYFYNSEGDYKFDASKLNEAHKLCYEAIEIAMEEEFRNISVSNTFTTEKELKPYLELASYYGYKVFSIIIENRNDNISVHNVPEETIQKMKNRFTIKL